MQAIILAAGYGRRMRPLTDSEHKTLLPIGGRTIIERIMDGLLQNGVRRIAVATGYLADRVEQHMRQAYPDVELTFVHNSRFDTTNNIHSLALVLDQLTVDEDTLLIESDLIFEPSVIRRIIQSSASNVALVDRYRRGMDGTVVTVAGGVITSIIPPHLQDERFDFSDKFKTLNIYKFSAEFCGGALRRLLAAYTSVFDENAYYELALGMLIYLQKATIHAEVIDGEKWAEVDDPNDLATAGYAFGDAAGRYAALEAGGGGYWNFDVLDFAYLRNMYFPTSAVLSEMRTGLGELVTQYGSRQDVLDSKLAYFLQCRPGNVCLLNGVSQAFPLLGAFYRGHEVLIPDPTFGEYERTFPGARTYPDRIGLDPAELEARARTASVVCVVNPNNPTGSVLASELLLGFARRHPDKVLVVDESFIDFAGQPSLLSLLDRRPLDNVVIIKSLSKPLGVPGLRIGALYTSDRKLLDFVHAALPIWNSNSLAENCLELILKHREALADSFTRTANDRAALAAALAAVPSIEQVYPSAANFVLVRLEERASPERLPVRLLERANIYVKDASAKFRDGRAYLRIAVRLPDENAALVTALRDGA